MHLTTFLFTTLLAIPTARSLALPEPIPLSPDPAGTKNIGNARGQQFIGGACLDTSDCASQCCARLNGAGICSGPGAQFQAGKQGCGFNSGSPTPPNTPPSAPGGVLIDTSIPGSDNVGRANGKQFITGQCTSGADCASTCCAGLPTANKGPLFAVCSGPAVGNQNGKTGCGFTVAGGGSPVAPAPSPPTTTPPPSTPGGIPIDTSIPGSQSVGKANGSQFITGQCISNADCASRCCAGLPTANKGPTFGVCSGPAVGDVNGKTGCGFVASSSSSSSSPVS